MAEKTTSNDGGAARDSSMHIENVPLDDLHAHPGNDYSQDRDEMQQLMESIEREGLGQLPLVRPLPSGGYQIVAGHRRVECFRRLNVKHPGEYATIPVNVRDNLDDQTALLLLNTTNLMTRHLSPAERAQRYERIWELVPDMRRKDESLRGVRTSQVIADIITRETGQSVSRASIDRAISAGKRAKEAVELADTEKKSLSQYWYNTIKETEGFTPDAVQMIAAQDERVQDELQATYQREQMTPKQLEKHLKGRSGKTDEDAERILDSMIKLARDLSAMKQVDGVAIDLYRLKYLKKLLSKL